jgi:hypothetical protein
MLPAAWTHAASSAATVNSHPAGKLGKMAKKAKGGM